VAALVFAAAVLGGIGVFAARGSVEAPRLGTSTYRAPAGAPLIGMVRTTEVKIQPEITGRIASIRVKPGDRVTANSVVAELSSPELLASVEEARAALAASRANRANVYAGVRAEEIHIAERDVQKAEADLTLAEEHQRRYAALVGRGGVSKADLDDADASLATARSALAAARSRHEQAVHGPTKEDRASADAAVKAAEASLAVLEQRAGKLTLHSAVNGTVQTVVGELGEAYVPGRTVLVLTTPDVPWFSFNVREDDLKGIDVGSPLAVTTSDGRMVEAKVTEVRRLGDFATWRAARAVGDHDLNTFAVRVEPVKADGGLQPGMTAWIVRR
jgi:HlyD family secretion protein